MVLKIEGGAGKDTILGGNGADVLTGGPDDDFVDGNQGADTVTLGDGADVFQWDPGDSNDTILGGAAPISWCLTDQAPTRCATCRRRRTTSVVPQRGHIVMDLDDIETIDCAP